MRLLRERRGNAAIEFAFVGPVLLLAVMGGLNYGIGIFRYMELGFATESAARCAALGQCTSDQQTIDYASQRAGLDGATFTTSMQGCGRQVDGSYTHSLISMFPDLNLLHSACYPVGGEGGGSALPPITVSQLVNCDNSQTGTIRVVTDAGIPQGSQQYYMSTVCASGCQIGGGGTNTIPVVCDPNKSNWIAH